MMQTASAWWDTNWQERKEITFDHRMIPESLEYYPVLINLSDSDLYGHIQDDGGDIAFVAGNDSYQLYHEIEYLSIPGASGPVELVAWVNVTRVSSSSNTTMYMYYNNSGAGDQWNNASTWHSNYVLVCHLNTSFNDSTIYGNHGTEQTVIPPIDGQVAYGQDFERGDSDYVNYSTVGDYNQYTIEFWNKFESLPVPEYIMGYQARFSFLVETNNNLQFDLGIDRVNSGVGVYNTGQWLYTAGSCNGTTMFLYTDGVQKGTKATTVNLNTSFWIGMEMGNPGNDHYDGIVDEFRISKTCWNSSWITTCYNNVYNATDGGFFSLGPVTTRVNNSPFVSVYNPADQSIVYNVSSVNVSVYIEDAEGDLFNYTIETSPDIGHRYGNLSVNGTKEANVSGLEYGTTYTVFVNTTDPDGSGNWTNISYSFTTIGGLDFWCYNEANMSQTIGFDLIISNQDGTEVYTASDLTSNHSINTSVMPKGENTVFIVSNESFKTRVYYYDITDFIYLNLSFYLPPLKDDTELKYSSEAVSDPTVDVTVDLDCDPDRVVLVQGWNESLYGHWFIIPDDNYTVTGDTVTVDAALLDDNTTVVQVQYYCSDNVLDYIIHVVDTIGNVISDAKVNVRRLHNTTYVNMTSVLTDGNGDATVYLIPDEHYRILISKDGYVTSYADYLPSESVRTKTYQLTRESDETNASHWMHDVSIDAVLTNGCTLWLNYTDSRANTSMVNVTVERWNGSAWNDSFYFYNDTADSFSVNIGVSCEFGYRVVFLVTHGDYDVFIHTVLLNKQNLSVTSASDLEDMFDSVLGDNPFGWLNFFAIFIMLACFFAFGEAGAGISLIGCGFVFLFLNVLIVGFIVSTMVPILFIVLGFLVEWKYQRRNA